MAEIPDEIGTDPIVGKQRLNDEHTMAVKTLTTTTDSNTAGRVDKVVRQMTEASHSQVRGLIDHGCVSINDSPCTDGSQTVKPDDVVSIRYDPNQRYHVKKKSWDDRTFDIVFEDKDLIVVDKAAGTLTVPRDDHELNTLVDRVSIYLSHGKKTREALVVHRLDRALSGLLVFGKHKGVADMLNEQFQHQRPQRVYTAIVAGEMKPDEGTYRSWLGTRNDTNRFVTHQSEESELAITHFKVVKRMSNATQLDVTLETAQRHQIRVQLSNAGFPVLGDSRYTPEKATHPRWIRKRIALHARTLGFVHPITKKTLYLESVLPPALRKFVGKK